MRFDCFECDATIEGDDVEVLGDRFVHHAGAEHDLPYPARAMKNYVEATLRLTGGSERLDVVSDVTVHPISKDRIDDWLGFFDHDAFVGTPEWAGCYCLEPHVTLPQSGHDDDVPHWRDNREAMVDRLEESRAFGYLAYVDGRVAGWVNASLRSDYTLYSTVDRDGPPASDVVGVACFVIAPPYRRHGVAVALLDRVIEDAAGRGVGYVEAYPFNEQANQGSANFRGARSMYESRGFEKVEVRGRDTVMRRIVS